MTMNYGPGKGDGSGSNRSTIGANVPKFFRIVSDPELHRLKLPTVFMRRHGHNLLDSASLKVPSGLVWKVELIHSNRESWLQRGWEQFAECYSISFGHFLVFKYVGDSHFEVHIFDTTATEIDYSHYDSLRRDAGSNQVARNEGIESESDDSVVFLRETFTGKNVRSRDQDHDRPSRWERNRRMPESGDLHSEKLRKSFGKEQKRSSAVKESRFMASSPNHRSDIGECSKGTGLKSSDRKQVQQQARDVNNRCEAYTRALAFMSEKPTQNPFSIVVMHPSYVINRYPILHIPPAFAKEFLPGKGNSSFLLVSEGKSWLVRCICKKERASLTSGWRKFVEDNNLKVGDACVFEVSGRIDPTWDVMIFRS